MRFYYLHYAEEKEYEPYGVAYAPENTDLFLLPVSGVKVTSWSEIIFNLKDGDFSDYLANDLGCRLCSEKLKKTIEEGISDNDRIQWMKTVVVNDKGDYRNYYILHFPVNMPIINKKESIMAGDDVVIKPVLSKGAVQGLNIFTIPNEGGVTTFVSGKMRILIESRNFTGLGFSKISAS